MVNEKRITEAVSAVMSLGREVELQREGRRWHFGKRKWLEPRQEKRRNKKYKMY